MWINQPVIDATLVESFIFVFVQANLIGLDH